MRSHQLFVRAVLILGLGLALPFPGQAADNFRKLKDAQIKARLAGMEVTDGVHWAEQFMRDGTYKAFHLGKASKGKWAGGSRPYGYRIAGSGDVRSRRGLSDSCR